MNDKATISPSIHELTIKRHMGNDDDAAMRALFDAVKTAREMCEKSATMTQAVLQNSLKTIPQRHKDARAASFELLERATKALDQAVQHAEHEIEALHKKLKGPPAPKDAAQELRAQFLITRLATLSPEQRKAVVASDDVLGAILNMEPWVSGIDASEVELLRHGWQKKYHGKDLDRVERLQKAIADSKRAGSPTIGFIDTLTDAEIVNKADALDKAAADAPKQATG